MPANVDSAKCANLASQYAAEFIAAWGRSPRTQVTHKTRSGDAVEFEIRRRDPEPMGEVIWGRVLCRQNALAVASCTADQPPSSSIRVECGNILASMQISTRPKQPPGPTVSTISPK
jgi:hypothetical protein